MLPFVPLLKKLWLPVLLLGGLMVFFASGVHTTISWQGIAHNYAGITGFADDHLVMAALGFALLYLLAVAFSLPIALFLSLTGGAVFGWLAVPLIVAGATHGAGIVFLAARTIFADERTGAPNGMSGPPTEPYWLPPKPKKMDVHYYFYARYSDGEYIEPRSQVRQVPST